MTDMDRHGGSDRRMDLSGDPAVDTGKTPLLTSDAYYKERLRVGCIDFNRQHPPAIGVGVHSSHIPTALALSPRNNPGPITWPTSSAAREGGRGKFDICGGGSTSRDSLLLQSTPQSRRPLLERHPGLHRSNSSLELDRYADGKFIGDTSAAPSAATSSTLRRDYGSADSLDDAVHCFSAKARSFRSNMDSLEAPGNLTHQSSSQSDFLASRSVDDAARGILSDTRIADATLANGFLPVDDETSSTGPSRSPNFKSKSQKSTKDRKRVGKPTSSMVESGSAAAAGNSSGSLFRKLRGVRSDPSTDIAGKVTPPEAESNPKLEERQRRKAFGHYDCQSIGVNLADVIKRRAVYCSGSDAGLLKRANTTTGASAASGNRGGSGAAPTLSDATTLTAGGPSANVDDLPDFGDGKSNELIQSCSFFRNEIGGEEERTIWLCKGTADRHKDPHPDVVDKSVLAQMMPRSSTCNGVAVLDSSANGHGKSESPLLLHNNLVLEYVDQGAYYYRNFFYDYDHQNFFGIDESLGPVAVSVRREKVCDVDRSTGSSGTTTSTSATATAVATTASGSSTTVVKSDASWSYQYRVIIRTSELTTLRGTVLEDCIPSATKLSSARGLSPKDLLEFVAPNLNISCLRLALVGGKTNEQLLKLDEQRINKTYKIGIMLCRKGQSTEEDMYNNERATPEFDEFLELIGNRVQLKSFGSYRGGLDVKTDSTGTYSLYTKLGGSEIMFHVSTMLPFTPNNRQQLLRKRHIGNDIVTIVFQEPGALPFTPKSIRSQFQHVFIVVHAHSPTSSADSTRYSVAVSRSKNVPSFGPSFPKDVLFDKSDAFWDFLLVKAINAENAVHHSDKFVAMGIRTRQEYLKDLATNHVTSTVLDSGSRLGKFSLGSGRKKDKSKLRSIPDIFSKSAIVWSVTVEDFCLDMQTDGFLAVSAETIAIVEDQTKEVIFTMPCKAVIGWTILEGNGLRIFYNRGECTELFTSRSTDSDEVREVVSRLEYVTNGCKTEEMSLQRSSNGQLGFHVNRDGIVTDVEMRGSANAAGLKPYSRLVKICEVVTSTMTHDQMIDLLRTAQPVFLTIILPHDDGQARRGCDDVRTSSPTSHGAALMRSPTADDAFKTALNFRYDNLPPSAGPLSPPILSGSEPQFHLGGRVLQNAPPPGITSRQPENGDRRPVTSSRHDLRFLDGSQDGNSNGDGEGQRSKQPPFSYYPAYSKQDLTLASTVKFDAARNPASNGDAANSAAATHNPSAYSSTEPIRPVAAGNSLLVGRHSYKENLQQRLLAAGDWNRIASAVAAIPAHGHGAAEPEVIDPSRSSHPPRLDGGMRDDFAVGYRRQMAMSPPAAGNGGGTGGMSQASLPQHRSHHDISTLQSFNDTSSPGLTKKGNDGSVASPRLRSATIHRMSPHKAPSSSSSSSTFQNDLMRLIDTDISDYDLHRTLSDKGRRHFPGGEVDSGIQRKGSATNLTTISLPAQTSFHDHRPLPRTTIDVPGTDFRLQFSSSTGGPGPLQAIPLPDATTGNLNWDNLVAAANKCNINDNESLTARGSPRLRSGVSLKNSRSMDFGMLNLGSQTNRLSTRDLTGRRDDEDRPALANISFASDGTKSDLESRVADLERRLVNESKERESLENEVNSLRRENLRLHDESQAAAAQLRRFSGWFFNTIDRR